MTERLHETLEHFRSAFEDAPIGMALVSVDVESPGRYLTVNPAFCAITGYSKDQLLSRRYGDITHPDDLAKGQSVEEAMAEGRIRSFQIEKRYLHADGHVVWVSLNGSLVGDADGSTVCWLTFLLDETERKQTEVALRKQEHQLAEAQRLAQLGSWEWDVAENRIVWSDELYRIFGLDPQEFEATYEAFLARVHPDDRERVNASVQRALGSDESYDDDVRVVRPDGSVYVTHARGQVVRDADGRPIRMVGTAHDITAARSAEAALRVANSRLELLGAISAAANEASDLGQALQTAVDQICLHNGWPVGHAYLSAQGRSSPLVCTDIWHLGGDPARYESFRRRTEASTDAADHALPRRALASGDVACIKDLLADASFTSAREAQAAGLRAGIAFRVLAGTRAVAVLEFFDERPIEIDEDLLVVLNQIGTQLGRVGERQQAREDLARARDQAMEASRAKSDFLATMSHEIRTPMNGVIGLTGLLLDSQLTETQRHHAEGVRTSGEALLGIINDILDFSKIEAGKLELETVDFDLAEAMDEVAALVSESARAKGLELVAYCHPAVPTALRGDVGRLRQVLLNFATNAIKFTEAGEVVLRAKPAEDASGGRVVVRLEVCDTGVGVDPARAERLFEPFAQADASTTRRYGGTGLGLAICRRLAEAMGGDVGVDSQPGKGSTFWLRVPLAHAAEPIAPAERTGHALEGRRVLVVDDNETNRVVLASQLRAWDISTDLAADAEEALEGLREAATAGKPYDLALVDLAMPGMDGLELGAIVSADTALAAVRLLLLSSVPAEVGAAEHAGFVARLTKPVRLSSLYDALVRAVTPSSVDKRAPTSPAARTASRGTLLIVEDHAINQEVARGILAKLGYGSDVAGDGIEALQALRLRSYDAVLMDCHMPEMDGFEATAEIRRREAGRSHVPIIAMTAGALVEDRERCLAAGMDDYVSKPVKERQLDAKLRHWLGRKPAPERPAADGGNAPADGRDVLDAAQFDGLRQLAAASGDPEFLRGFVDRYLDRAASDVVRLRQAASRRDAAALREVVHGLKGSSATIGASGVAAACAALEEAAARGDVPGPQELERVVVELERAAAALRAGRPTGS